NPLGYVPFYLAVSAGLHSVLVSALFAAAHGLNLAFLYLIGRELGSSRALAALGAALGAASAVFAATVGTSFLDPLLTVPMLAAVLLLVRTPARGGWAGILFGVAAALKYSNAFFALAALVLIRERRTLLAYVLGGAAAVLTLAAPWMLVLYREFGNPVFPHLNSIFRSPDFPAISLGAERFAPRDLGEALTFPFRLASPEFMTYAEIAAPDLRFCAVLLALLALGIVAARRRNIAPGDVRFIAFFVIATAAWIATSGNGRYGMLVLLLVGPCLARAVEAGAGMRVARIVLPVVLVAQVAALAMNSHTRWFLAESWSREWFPFVVPERAQREPTLYLTMEAQTMSVVAPYLHPQSSFVNLRGQHSVAPGWKRVQALLARHGGKARALGRGLRLQADGLPRPEVVEAYDSTMLRFGFRLDTSDCFAIGWRGEEDALAHAANTLARLEPKGRVLSLASCALVPGVRDPRDIAAEERMSVVFDRIERQCPRLFRGHTAITEPLGEEWSRTYAGLEARLQTHAGRVVLAPFFLPAHYDLGRLADWEGAGAPPQPPACRDAS
ncbi:MAG TPA: glycosyltransferase family 87 protein, partial [Burkholderiales bacterium]|nr:glycosyltransferase family 87 protein [Burkholderiales bacterium]